MNEKNLSIKLLLVFAFVGLMVAAIIPIQERLKFGIDLAGGHSLLYEIDTSGMGRGAQRNLAQDVMKVLRDRVDPDGVRNLVWRPIGNNRLEIQMPSPTEEASVRRQAYETQRDALSATNIRRVEVETTLSKTGDERRGELDKLIHGVTEREPLLDEISATWDAYQAAKAAGNAESEDKSIDQFDALMTRLMDETNINLSRFGDILAMPAEARDEQLAKITSMSPSRKDLIGMVVAAYDGWNAKKGPLEDPADLQRLLRGAGVLEFRILPENEAGSRAEYQTHIDQLRERGPNRRGGGFSWHRLVDAADFVGGQDRLDNFDALKNGMSRIVERYGEDYYVLAYDRPDMGLLANSDKKWSLERAQVSRDPGSGRLEVLFTLDPRGGAMFFQLTSANVNRPLGILLDNELYSAPNLQSAIRQSGRITGDFTQEEVSYLANTLEAGSLPARLKEPPLMIRSIGPNLGQSNRDQGLRAAVIGFAFLAVFVLLYYWLAGFVANVALVMNLIIVLGIMATLEATFTLPGIAGLILTVGMAVDANVLIFERIREEQERGVSLRLAIKNGYEKAFSTILDANVTTLITCVILGYLGSEEVKGFAWTLGFGIVASMFTALVVTRLVFTWLISKGMIKSLKMMHLFKRPNIDWLAKRKIFGTVSTILVVLGLSVFFTTPGEDKLDIEFLGGTSAQIKLKPSVERTDEEIRGRITGEGLKDGEISSTSWLLAASETLKNATVSEAGTDRFEVKLEGMPPAVLGSFMEVAAADVLVKNGITETAEGVVVETRSDSDPDNPDKAVTKVSLDRMKQIVKGASTYASDASKRLAQAKVQETEEFGAEAGLQGKSFEVVTTETSTRLVREAILASMPDMLDIQQELTFAVRKDPERGPQGYYPITVEDDRLGEILGDASLAQDVRPYRGGTVSVFDEVTPPQTANEIRRRLRNMRLQPDFEQFEWRDFDIFGLQTAGQGEDGEALLSSFAVVVLDADYPYDDSPATWETNLARPELELTSQALETGHSMEKITQFAPQVAQQAQTQAIIAMVLALAAIVAYIWIRFGSMTYGLGAIMALVHDVAIALGLVTATGYLVQSPIGTLLGIGQTAFRIDLAMIAAFMTIIGYSLNDTIVVYDRIRENRGRLATLSATIINNSINQCLSRTMLTSLTTLIIVVVMYTVGGAGIHGFSFALLIGVVVGTYSSIGVASMLVYSEKTLWTLFPILVGSAACGIMWVAASGTFRGIALALIVAGVAYALYRVYSGAERATRPAAA
jgi:SecD/SecF fusion protein